MVNSLDLCLMVELQERCAIWLFPDRDLATRDRTPSAPWSNGAHYDRRVHTLRFDKIVLIRSKSNLSGLSDNSFVCVLCECNAYLATRI